MKIIKTKTIEAKDISEISDKELSDKALIDFKDRKKLHNGVIPDFFVYIQDYAWNAFVRHGENVYQEVRHEAQGIFVGHYFKDQFGEFVVATNYEEGNGNSQSTYVEMSEECLAKISEKCQIWALANLYFFSRLFVPKDAFSCKKNANSTKCTPTLHFSRKYEK